MFRFALILTFLAAHLTVAAEASDAPKPPPVGTLIHDLRDFLPESESKNGNPDDPIPGFSCKDDGYWKGYRSYNKNGKGYLSRNEIKVLVADLVKSLRVNYPDTCTRRSTPMATTPSPWRNSTPT